MKFTGDDLKLWNKTISGEATSIEIKIDEFKALLARLEAAEAIAKWCDEIPHEKHNGLYDAWRKSKGE